nr:hypothetical protein GCM10010200_083150 [Actinomadura rugatobispora]
MRRANEKGRARRIGKLHADKAYDIPELRRWLVRQHIFAAALPIDPTGTPRSTHELICAQQNAAAMFKAPQNRAR